MKVMNAIAIIASALIGVAALWVAISDHPKADTFRLQIRKMIVLPEELQ